ncbi:MAG: hypothetical protein FWB97_06860 [Oscillospiraceae bacterium]|nr:hypothetical protein [Oscillospiraceae bacterium]
MESSLFNLVQRYGSLSISGMCKNAGKTTALNSLVKNYPENETLALTSIGWDGEKTDTVTGTEKPGIYVREGSLFATSEKLLRSCDVTKEILETTGISTPLGEVVLVRALSDGNVQLAGPSIVVQLIGISKLFREHGASRTIIDGAVGRKTLCSRALAEATVLCAGASYSPSMEETIAEAAHMCSILTTAELPELKQQMGEGQPNGKYIIIGQENRHLPDEADILAEIKQSKAPRCLYIEGALTDSMLDPLVRSGLLREMKIATRDASRLLISRESSRKLKAAGGELAVLESINLAAVTINPYSAYGNHYHREMFMTRMKAAVPLPVVDVRE